MHIPMSCNPTSSCTHFESCPPTFGRQTSPNLKSTRHADHQYQITQVAIEFVCKHLMGYDPKEFRYMHTGNV